MAKRKLMDPVAGLREQATALEAAMTLVRVDGGEKAVHRLRTCTRRVEAQCELLQVTGVIADGSTRKLRRLLKEVRRSAGKVRDLDVQVGMIQKAVAPAAGEALVAEARKLIAMLERKRKTRARALLDDLEGHSRKLAPRLEALLRALGEREIEPLTMKQAGALTGAWYQARVTGRDLHQEDDLHDVRKAAKLARYMAETQREDAGLSAAAAGFEAIQEAGGSWHDDLTLREIAGDRLGKKSELAGLFAAREEAGLAAFQALLAGGRTDNGKCKRRSLRDDNKKASANADPFGMTTKRQVQTQIPSG